MKIKDIDFPETLLDAQTEGTLVIFAGAGVSYAPPSNLPDFKGLADKIVEGTQLVRKNEEPVDRFLRRAHKKGIQVHQITKDILNHPNSTPNSLHRNLLSLFSFSEEIHLVTTNFDTHFTTAAGEVCKGSPEIFYSPALPLGHNFNGLVYLHGSIEKNLSQMVLTDSDFGRAYLTEGWARRFLQDMFNKYNVLFVGYSYNDPVMQYLTRGLPPDTQNKRFALTSEGNDEHWEFLGITPITYSSENNHAALNDALAGWVELSQMGTLDHEQRIKEIVQSKPSLIQENNDYIEKSLRKLETTRFFTQYAKDPEWLKWLESKQLISQLFQSEKQADEISKELAIWFAENFVCDNTEEGLAILQRHGQMLNRVLCHFIVYKLWTCKPRPDASILAIWVTIVLASPSYNNHGKLLEYLLNKCRNPDDNFTAILLFEYLTKPQIRLQRSYNIYDDETSSTKRLVYKKVNVIGNSHWLHEAWNNILKTHLNDFAEKLEPTITNHLMQAHFLLKTCNKADLDFDIHSFHRSAIEPHDQDTPSLRKGTDILIDAARDIIEWMIKHKHKQAIAIIDAWINSGVPLLKRLAVHGITESKRLAADTKISWIIKNNLLYKLTSKHEIFRLLKETYPLVSKSIRINLLSIINQGPHIDEDIPDKKKISDYEIYSLLAWLHHAIPTCSITKQEFDDMQKLHTEFTPREHPDLDHYMEVGDYSPQSPVNADELLKKEPTEENVQWLLTYKGDGGIWKQPSREGLLNTLSEVVAKSFEWSWQWITVLQDKEEWNSDVWIYFIRGWDKSTLTKQQWMDLFTFFKDHNKLFYLAKYLSDLLQNSIEKFQDKLISAYLDLAECVVEQLWEYSANDQEETTVLSDDWFNKTIKHPGGKLVITWLKILSKRRSVKEKKEWKGIPDNSKAFLEKILNGVSYTAELGRVVLASQLYFLFSLDPKWTKDNILPLLDWDLDQKRAQQAWHGYLARGNWDNNLLQDILPLFKKSFPKLSDDLSTQRDRFSEFLADIALHGTVNPLKEGWLIEFLNVASLEDRKQWASHVDYQLNSLKDERIENLWNRWLNEYWTHRITGKPCPLSQDELKTMIDWAPKLKAVFPAAVDKICTSITNATSFELKEHHTYFYHQLDIKNFADTHPNPLIKLLKQVLPHVKEPFWGCREVEKIVKQLIDNKNVNPQYLKPICDELARLGCRDASNLLK